MKRILLIFCISTLIISCKHDLEKPTWNVDLLVPIANTQLSINNILSDTNSSVVQTDENGFVTLVFQEQFVNFNLDTLVDIQARADEKSTTLDSVIFKDVSITDTTTIGETISEVPFGNLLFPDGSMRTIPAMQGIAKEDTIVIDASGYFETMTLHTGLLRIKVKNGFPTDISNIDISLLNAVNQNVIASFNIPLIPTGTTAEDSVDIAGQVLDKNIFAILHNMDIEASNGDVLIDYSDAILTTVSIEDIGLIEATAIFPEQQLDSSKAEFSFELFPAEFTEMKIKHGHITLNVLSTLPDTGRMLYYIPSLTKNGLPFTSVNVIPPSINGELTMIPHNFDGYVLDLTGQDGRIGGDTVNTIYKESFTYIDSTGELVTINQTDSFYSFTEYDFEIEYARGFLGQDTILGQEEITSTSIFNNIIAGGIDFETAKLNLSIKNFIGADLQIKFDNLTATNTKTGKSVSAGFDFLSHFYDIPRATELQNINTPVAPSFTDIQLDADKMLEIFPDQFLSKINLFVNPYGRSSIPDFIYPAYTLDASLNLEIPLSMIANNLTLIDTLETNINLSEETELEKLFFTIKNGFPFDASLKFVLLDEYNNVMDTLLENTLILAGKTNTNGIVTESTSSVLTADYQHYGNIHKIIAITSFNTIPSEKYVKIYSDYKLEINVSAKLNKLAGE